jgi:hypothetical protein
MSLIHAYTSTGKNGIPSAIYEMMELHIEELIDSGILNMNLVRHQHIHTIQQMMAYTTYQTQNGPTCSTMKFWAIAKHLTINQKQTHEIEGIHNNMIIMKGKDKYHKLVTPNMATKTFHNNTRAVLNNPFEIDSQYKIENLPFSLKGSFNHFLEPITITALANINVKMDCKTGTKGNLKTITSKQDLKKGQAHTCAIQITTNGMTKGQP